MSILAKICTDKEAHVRVKETETPRDDLQKKIEAQPAPRGFIKNILTYTQAGKPALIAEIKKASPSGGIIRSPFDPSSLARAYESAGAACLSVLTDTPYFQGQDEDLRHARAACALPALRKDFMVAPYQIDESRALGADCILLIMAALDDRLAQELYDRAVALGMDVLIEVHDETELHRALALDISPQHALIGVNSRNLKTLAVTLQTAFDLLAAIPADFISVAESGIKTHDDLSALHKAGYKAFLVGESLMRQDDLETAVKKLLTGV